MGRLQGVAAAKGSRFPGCQSQLIDLSSKQQADLHQSNSGERERLQGRQW